MLWLALSLLLLLAAGGGAAPTADEDTDDMRRNNETRKQYMYRLLRALPQLTEDQRLLAILIAYGETIRTFDPRSHNNTAYEVGASEAAWNNNPKLAAKLVKFAPKAKWVRGSGGYGGRLFVYFGEDMIDAGMRVDPDLIFDPVSSLMSLLITQWKLQQTKFWKRSKKKVANLRIGSYGIGYMDNDPATDPETRERFEKYDRQADESRLPDNFIDRVLTDFPGPDQWSAMEQTLRAVA